MYEDHEDRDASLVVTERLLKSRAYRMPYATWNKEQAQQEHKLAQWADMCEMEVTS